MQLKLQIADQALETKPAKLHARLDPIVQTQLAQALAKLMIKAAVQNEVQKSTTGEPRNDGEE